MPSLYIIFTYIINQYLRYSWNLEFQSFQQCNSISEYKWYIFTHPDQIALDRQKVGMSSKIFWLVSSEKKAFAIQQYNSITMIRYGIKTCHSLRWFSIFIFAICLWLRVHFFLLCRGIKMSLYIMKVVFYANVII